MACGGCQQARARAVQAVRQGDLRGLAGAVRTGVQVNVDKLRGVDVNAKYGLPPGQAAIADAKPYRRTR